MVPNLSAQLCREIFDYLRREHSYGNKVTGKSLTRHFGGLGFGWQKESIRLALAVLLRGGSIELTHQGRKYWNYSEPACRVPFANNNAFNAASFAPREALDLKILASAANAYEDITGKEVDIEEGAIAQEFRQLAVQDRENLLPLVAKLTAEGLPESDLANAHMATLEGILDMPSDDIVKTLAGEGKSFLETRQQIKKIAQAATDSNLAQLRLSKRIVSEQWPHLQNNDPDESLTSAAGTAKELLDNGQGLANISKLSAATELLNKTYQADYLSAFEERTEVYANAIAHVKGLLDWASLDQNPDISDERMEALLYSLTEKSESILDLPVGATVCQNTGGTLPQLKSEIAAADSLTIAIIRAIEKLVAPDEKIERIRVSKVTSQRIGNEEELDAALKDIREHAMKLLKQNIKVIFE
jgi:hypothetical protein